MTYDGSIRSFGRQLLAESTINQLLEALETAENQYFRLVLLVGEAGSCKTAMLRAVAATFGAAVINVNLKLAEELLELTSSQRTLQLPQILKQIVAESPDPVILDNIEILFDTRLMQDPLRLLQGASRNRTVLASWNGSKSSVGLQYADSGHHEFRSYDTNDLLIVVMDSPARKDIVNNNKGETQA